MGLAAGPNGAILVGLNGAGGGISCVEAATATGGLVVGRPPSRLQPARSLGLNLDAGPAAAGGAAVALVSVPVGVTGNCDPTEDLEFADVSPTGVVTPAAVLEQATAVAEASVTGDARGDAAAAWIDDTGDLGLDSVLRVTFRPHGATAGGDQTVATADGPGGDASGIGSVATSMDAAGDTLIAYATSRFAYARTLSHDGQLGVPARLGPCDYACYVAADQAANGRAVVAWGGQSYGAEPNGPYSVRAAVRRGADQPFGPATLLDPGGDVTDVYGQPEVGITTGGRAAVVWEQAVGSAGPVRLAIAPPDRSFGPTITLAKTGSGGSIAVSRDNEMEIAWSDTPVGLTVGPAARLPQPAQSVRAILLAPADRLLPPAQTVASVPFAAGTLAGFNSIGSPVIAWTVTEGATNQTDVAASTRG